VTGRVCAGAVALWLSGCSSFVGADLGGEGSSSGPGGATTSTGSAESGTTDAGTAGGGAGTTGNTGGSGPSTTGSDATTAADTGQVASSGDSTDGGEESSSGGDDSTGDTPLTCQDLALPEVPAMACSTESIDLATLTIHNDCEGVRAELYWVGFGCEETLYATIEAGDSWTQSTYLSHPWRIRNASSGVLMREIPPVAGDLELSILQR